MPGELSSPLVIQFGEVPNGLAAWSKGPSADLLQMFLFAGLVEKGWFQDQEAMLHEHLLEEQSQKRRRTSATGKLERAMGQRLLLAMAWRSWVSWMLPRARSDIPGRGAMVCGSR